MAPARLQAITTAAWTALCLLMVAQSSRHLQPAAVQLLWTFFQPAGPMLLMLVLYARAVAYFEQHHIPHEECYADSDRRFLASSRDLFSLARVLACFAAACMAASAALCAAGGHAATAAAILVPPLMYSSAAALMLMPVNAFVRRPSKVFFCRTLGRVLIPTRPVSWADFLLADILTSLAKSSSDLSRSTCLILHGQLAHPMRPESAAAAATCGPLTAVSLSALVLPYLLRMVQCVAVWRAGGPVAQLFNALKYASSLPALMLTQMEHEHHVHRLKFPLRRMWLGVMLLNSTYSFYWDVEQDWDLPWLTQYGGRKLFGFLPLPGLKGSHLYSPRWYAWLLASNLVLRFSWAHRLLGDLEAHSSVLMVVALLEVVRRWQWLYVRVETELRKLRALQLLPKDSDEHIASE